MRVAGHTCCGETCARPHPTTLSHRFPATLPTTMRSGDDPMLCSTTAAQMYNPMQPASMTTMKRSESEMNDSSCSRGNRMDLRQHVYR